MARTKVRFAGRAGGAGRALLGAGEARKGQIPAESGEFRYVKYALVTLAGFAAGLLLSTPKRKDDGATSSPPATPGTEAPTTLAARQTPPTDEEPATAGLSEETSGDDRPSRGEDVPQATPPEPPEETLPTRDLSEDADRGGVEGRVRTRIGADSRTGDLLHLTVVVNDGMVTIEGSVPSVEVKEALTEVVREVEGVNIVVNRVRAGSAS